MARKRTPASTDKGRTHSLANYTAQNLQTETACCTFCHAFSSCWQMNIWPVRHRHDVPRMPYNVTGLRRQFASRGRRRAYTAPGPTKSLDEMNPSTPSLTKCAGIRECESSHDRLLAHSPSNAPPQTHKRGREKHHSGPETLLTHNAHTHIEAHHPRLRRAKKSKARK